MKKIDFKWVYSPLGLFLLGMVIICIAFIAFPLKKISNKDIVNQYLRAERSLHQFAYQNMKSCNCSVIIIDGSEEIKETNEFLKYSLEMESFDHNNSNRYRVLYTLNKITERETIKILERKK